MGSSNIVSTPTGKYKITVSQPKRDAEGKTAFDRIIEKNKKKKSGSSSSSKLPTQELQQGQDIVITQGDKTYTGKVTNDLAIGVRTVSKEEQAQRKKSKEIAASVQSAREMLRPVDMSVEKYRFLTRTETPKDMIKRETNILRTDIKQYVINKDVFLEYKKVDPVQSISSTNVAPKNKRDQRIENLLAREKRLETGKQAVYEFLRIDRKESDSKLSFGGVVKATARAPFEIASLPVFIGGRTAFTAEALFSKEGRSEVGRALKLTPQATLQSIDPRSSEGLVNLGLSVLAVKSVASKPPSFIQKASSRYVPYKDAGFKVVPDVTQPYARAEILKVQGKQVTGVHTSFSNLFGKSFGEFLRDPIRAKTETTVTAFPEQAKGFRKAIGQYSFYKSLPEKTALLKEGIVEPQAYSGYIGITESAMTASRPKIKFSFGEPKRYAYLFENEVIEPISTTEIAGIKKGGVAGGRMIIDYQKTNPGKSFIAAENLLSKSIEGQYTTPEGTVLKLTESGKYTLFREPSKFTNPTLKSLQEKTGLGLKTYRIDIAKVESQKIANMPKEFKAANLEPLLETPSRPTISRPIKSPAVTIYTAPIVKESLSRGSRSAQKSIISVRTISKSSTPSQPLKLSVFPSSPSRSRSSVSRAVSSVPRSVSRSVVSVPRSISSPARSISSLPSVSSVPKSVRSLSRISRSRSNPIVSQSLTTLPKFPEIEPYGRFESPKIKPQAKKRTDPFKPVKFKTKYVPSLKAEIFNIKGSRSRFAEISGLGTRFITRGGGI